MRRPQTTPSWSWSRSSTRIEVVTRMRSFMVVFSLAFALLLVAPRLQAQPIAPAPGECSVTDPACVAAATAPSVPEPASLVLLGLGLFGAGVATRRRA